jgi:tetratricopeptide (TPR) repeat protein
VKLNPDLLDAQLQLGNMVLLSGATEEAAQKAEIVLAKAPQNPEALILKGSILFVQKEYGEVIALLDNLLARDVKKPEIYQLLASAHVQNKDLEAAEKAYQDGVAANPKSVPLHLARAKFYQDRRQVPQAIAALKNVIELEPDTVSYRFNLINLYWKAGSREAAIDLIDSLITADPANEDNRVLAARFYLSKRQFPQAENILKAGLQQNTRSFKLRIMLAELYFNSKSTHQGIEILEECLELDDDPANPNIIQTKNALARFHLNLRQVEEARTYTDEVLEHSPKSVEGHFNRGRIYLISGDGVNAVTEFRTVVNERPRFISAYLRLTEAHVVNQELELAADTLQNALKVDPGSKEVRRALSRIYVMKKDYDAAEEQLRAMVAMDPADAAARADLGDFLLAKKDTEGARGQYRAIKRDAPQNPLGYQRMSRYYLRLGEPQKAIAELEAGFRQNPDSAAMLTNLIQAYVRQEETDKALALCKKRIQDNPGDAVAYNLLGWVHSSLKNYREAEEALQKAIDIRPGWAGPRNNLARVYLARGKKKEAIEKYEAAIQTNPNDLAAYLSLGLLYEGDRDFENAIRVYERALIANRSFWFAANNLAFLLSVQSDDKADLERALGLAKQALSLRPNQPGILDTLGWVHYRLGDYNQARDLLQKALAGAPDSPMRNYHMGMVLYKSGQTNEARAKLKKALESDEDFYGRDDAEKTLEKLKGS